MLKLEGCDLIIPQMFIPQDTTLKDDALHKTRGIGHVETWYYDAMLNDGYSMVTLVNVIRTFKIGLVIASLFIYKDGSLMKSIKVRKSSKHFYGSEDQPLLILNGKQILRGVIEPDTDNWIFHLSMGDQNQGVNLELVKASKAWKGKTYLGYWLVIPKFKVDGTIFLGGKNISVHGEGYHDHNIYPVYAPLMNKGYNFGKLRVGAIDVTWARVRKNRDNDEVIVVINKDDKYFSIPPSDINFTVENYTKDHRKIIPTKYNLKIDNDDVYLNVKIESMNFHHLSVPTVNYWRHHVKNIGEIKIDSVLKKIDNIEIAEQLIFL